MHVRPRVKNPLARTGIKKKHRLKREPKIFDDIMMTHFKFPYPFFQCYEFTLIKKRMGKKWVGVKREMVGGVGSGRVRG